MKNTKRKLTLGITAALISVLSISIGATVIRNTKNSHVKYYSRPAEEPRVYYPPAVVKYKGELIPLVQLPEVTIKDTAVQKQEVKK